MSRVTSRFLAAVVLASVLEAGHGKAGEPVGAKEHVVFRTSMGDFVLALYPDVARQRVEQVLRLVRLGIYDDTYIYTVDPSFVIQFADARDRTIPLTPEQLQALRRLPPEPSDVPHRRGAVTMSQDDAEHDAETSFGILLADAPHLDGRYTVFGYVETGFEVLDAMTTVEKDIELRPLTPIKIERAELVESPAALARMRLRGPRLEPSRQPAAGSHAWLTWPIAAMMACALASARSAGRLPSRAVATLGLLTVLIGFFPLFAILTGVASTGTAPWIGVLVFAGSIALFRLMAHLEGHR